MSAADAAPPTSDAAAAIAAEAAAEDLRQRGNHEFSLHHYDHASQLYTQALEEAEAAAESSLSAANDAGAGATHQIIANLCNRSACHYQMEDYMAARADALRAYQMATAAASASACSDVDDDAAAAAAIKLLLSHRLKAGFRLAKTHAALKEYGDAKQVIQDSLQLLGDKKEMEEDGLVGTTNKDDKEEQRPDDDTSKDSKQPPSLSQQRKAFEDLWKQVLQAAFEQEKKKEPGDQKGDEEGEEASICDVQRPVSIREFERGRELGFGNFSEVVVVRHKVTGEPFALKIIEKKRAAELAKRQHPNVYNEIQMERRVLLERLPRHRNIIRMYHSFQDYNSLFYLMELHEGWSDLWSELKYYPPEQQSSPPQRTNSKYYMIGCRRSQAVVWMAQLLDAMEHMHKHGIVHRDLKPENLLLTQTGSVIVIDFGTAKDLLETDLNGPEFVGTPDFMGPEAVNGTSGMQEAAAAVKAGKIGAVHTADLWAFGAILFLLQTGTTPFWSPSTYLAMMRIKRGLIRRPQGIVDDEAWDLIEELMRMDPTARIGAGAFELVVESPSGRRRIQPNPGGYDCIRQHPYFAAVYQQSNPQQVLVRTPVPTLRDLCYTPVAEQAYLQAQDVQLCDDHPPGDGSRHDMMRLGKRDRDCVMHVLDRMKLLRDPRVYARFFTDLVECRVTSKIRPATRDVVGLTQMNDDMYKPAKAAMNDQYATPVEMDYTIDIVHLTNPLFVRSMNESCRDDEDQRKLWVKLLKKCIAAVNRSRPKLVVVVGYVDDKCRKLLARVSESVPVVVHDGSAFFTFWMLGVQCIALQAGDPLASKDSAQNLWLREQLEQVRMSKHPLFVFADTDPRGLPASVLKQLARGRTLALYGMTDKETFVKNLSYEPNETVDDQSVKSTDSEEDGKDAFTMKMRGTHENGLHSITVDEEPDSWHETFRVIGLGD